MTTFPLQDYVMPDLHGRIETLSAAEGGAVSVVHVTIVEHVGGVVRLRLPMSIEDDHGEVAGAHVTGYHKPPDVGWELDPGDCALDVIEPEVLDAAWRSGAWDVARIEMGPLPDGADWREMRYGVTAAFGDPLAGYVNGFGPLDASHVRAWHLCPHAARRGWIDYKYKPVAVAPRLWRASWIAKDRTVDDAGRRGELSPCPIEPPHLDLTVAQAHQHVWTFGRRP